MGGGHQRPPPFRRAIPRAAESPHDVAISSDEVGRGTGAGSAAHGPTKTEEGGADAARVRPEVLGRLCEGEPPEAEWSGCEGDNPPDSLGAGARGTEVGRDYER